MMVLGIDPGLKGGYALLSNGGDLFASPTPIYGKEIDVREMRDVISSFGDPDMVVVEKVHSMPQQGVASTFTFGKGFGKLLGLCDAMDWPMELISPQAWKKEVLRGTTKDKAAAIEFCHQRYPGIALIPKGCRVPHDGIADAVCLAHLGLKKMLYYANEP